jgi:hypothetical protein
MLLVLTVIANDFMMMPMIVDDANGHLLTRIMVNGSILMMMLMMVVF